ncbi:hypothetical protein Tco_0802530 [Tanacetum coccineum]|uniref:Uncharacterized protein n=1 Tax=Tanacetum coccineum TaxID=301880 RepID=A0ABQ5A383_9ASTR
MMLATKYEAGIHLDEEENDFMLMSASGEEQLEELNASVITMARIQPADNDFDAETTYDSDFVSELNDSHIDLINGLLSKSDHEQQNREKLETIKFTSFDDQIDCNIIFDDPYKEVNSRQVEHATMFMIKKMKKKNALIAKELKTYKERVQNIENKPAKNTNFKMEFDKLQTQFLVEKQKIKTLEKEKDASNSNVPPKIESPHKSSFPPKEMLKLSRMLHIFANLDDEIKRGETDFANDTIVEKMLKEEFTKEVQEILNVFGSMDSEVGETLKKQEILQNVFNRLLEATLASDVRHCVVHSAEQIEIRDEIEKVSNNSRDVQANLLKWIMILENDFFNDVKLKALILNCNYNITKRKLLVATLGRVKKSNSDSRPKSKSTKSKKSVLLNTKSKSTSKESKNEESYVRHISNKHVTSNSNVSKTKANVLNTNVVNAVNVCSNFVCVSCGQDVVTICHDKCVSRYVLSVNSKAKRALFTSPVAAKTKVLRDTPLAAKTRFNVATPVTALNKVSSATQFNPVEKKVIEHLATT